MSSIQTPFSGPYIERLAELRTDAAALQAARSDTNTRFIVLWQQRCLADDSGPVLLRHEDLSDGELTAGAVIFLGRLDERYLFSVALDDNATPAVASEADFKNLRELSNVLNEDTLGLLGYARAMHIWHERHRFCGICGYPNVSADGGFVLVCSNDEFKHRVFPRLDPAIIVLVKDGENCLLGRQASWPEDRFSTIAGFVEPGESLEDAVRREVREETNIVVSECRYLASQPWPFPSSLMIGYHGVATSRQIRLNDQELAEARWVSRDDIAAGRVILPPRMSVAYRLIEAWFDQSDGPSLHSLGLNAPPLIVARKQS